MRRLIFGTIIGSLVAIAAVAAAIYYYERPSVLRIAVPRDSDVKKSPQRRHARGSKMSASCCYRGEIVHHGTAYPGRHKTIIMRSLSYIDIKSFRR